MANILLEQAFRALDEIQDEIDVKVEDLKESAEIKLPTEVSINLDVLVDEPEEVDDSWYFDEVISDYLSDEYGFCHYGFDYTVDKDAGLVHVTDIKWDTSESLDKYITEADDLEDKKENVRRAYKGGDMFDVYEAFEEIDEDKTNKIAEKTVKESHYAKETGIESLDDLWEGFEDFGGDEDYDEVLLEVIHALDDAFGTHIYDDIYESQKVCEKCGKNPCECLKEEEKHVCEKCGKEVCECDKQLQEGPNTTTAISVLDDGEKVIKQVGYSALTKKLVNGKPVYVVKYAPGYYVNDIEAKNDKEATLKFLGKFAGITEDFADELNYYAVSYGNPYKARIFDNKESAIEFAKSQNSKEDKEGEWEVTHHFMKDKALVSEPIEESLDEAKHDELAIKYWIDEEHRDQGISELYFGEIKDLEDAKHIADKLFDEYASVEVVKNVDTEDEEVLYGRYPEEESLDESISDDIKNKADELRDSCKDMSKDELLAQASNEHTFALGSKSTEESTMHEVNADAYRLLAKEKDKNESLDESKETLKKERDELWAKMPDCTKDELQRLIDIRKELGDNEFYTESLTCESLTEALSADEKSVSEEHKEDEKIVCAKCGSEEVKFNDIKTKEPLCADCYEKSCKEHEKEEQESYIKESITVNINDEDAVKKAKEEVEKSEKEDDTYEQIVDVDADSIEELKDSYLGNVILVCTDCKTPRFIKPELLVKDEETGLFNVGEPCSHCGSEKGYTAEGQVATSSIEVDKEDNSTTGATEVETKVEVEEKEEEKSEEEKPLPSAIESKQETSRLEKVDLNEQRFDRLVNKFVHTTYENVENYKTNSLYLDDDNTLIVEGVIKYTSGKEKEAQFKLTEKKLNTQKEDAIALTGICEAFNTSERAFTFRGTLSENVMNLSSLTFNFNTKVLNENKNIKGKVLIRE